MGELSRHMRTIVAYSCLVAAPLTKMLTVQSTAFTLHGLFLALFPVIAGSYVFGDDVSAQAAVYIRLIGAIEIAIAGFLCTSGESAARRSSTITMNFLIAFTLLWNNYNSAFKKGSATAYGADRMMLLCSHTM